jgi:hypothetical protein
MGRLCYPTLAPPEICPGRPENGPGARRVWRVFLQSGYKFYRSRACRGTSLIEAGKLSRYRMFFRGAGAVSRYKFDRSQKSVTEQDFNWEQMRVSGCKNHYQFVWGAGVKAKTMTNNLPILSVLAFRAKVKLLLQLIVLLSFC